MAAEDSGVWDSGLLFSFIFSRVYFSSENWSAQKSCRCLNRYPGQIRTAAGRHHVFRTDTRMESENINERRGLAEGQTPRREGGVGEGGGGGEDLRIWMTRQKRELNIILEKNQDRDILTSNLITLQF